MKVSALFTFATSSRANALASPRVDSPGPSATTLIRFDSVYFSHFKCNLRRVADYPNLWNYTRELYQVPQIAETVSIDQIKTHYYGSQRQVNPTGIVPIGPLIDFSAPHDRGRFG